MNKLIPITFILILLFMVGCTPGDPPEESVPSTTPTSDVSSTSTIAPSTATITMTEPAVKPTKTPMKATETAVPTDTPEATATITSTPTATIAPLPDTFTLTLFATDETTCGYPDFDFIYDVTLTGETMTLVQVINGLTLTGPYDPASGEFSVSISGLPGTEIYAGIITFDGITITITGSYTYTDDPGQACEGLWTIFGETTP